MKKHRISLSEFKVSSFIIEASSEKNTVKGGLNSGHVLCFTSNCEITKFRTDCC